MSVLQIVGTLLAIPVGIGSAYSMYRANFSVETTCQSLRGNIVAMLDKSVDPNTRHMLVRRDVEAFENSCGAVDPDATAAFKALLAADKTPAPVATATVRPVEPRPETTARKAEPRLDMTLRQPAANANAASAETEPVQRDAAASDAVWVEAVRRALVTHTAAVVPPADAVTATTSTVTPAAVRPPAREAHSLGQLPAPPPTNAAPTSAPALPPAMSVAVAPAPRVDADHPVPPAPIPALTLLPKEGATTADGRNRSRLGELVAQIPLVGWAFER